MKTNFHKLFGYDCPYLAERLYDLLSSGYTLDKPLFLRSMKELIYSSKKEQTFFAYRLYHARESDGISAADVSDMLRALPTKTPVFRE
jgi:hypothetical protein